MSRPPVRWMKVLAVLMLLASAELRAMGCAVANAPQFNFGAYDPLSPLPLDVQTSLVVQCTPAFPGETLRMQVSFAGINAPMQMLNPQSGDLMRFGLYSDPARSLPIDSQQVISFSASLWTATTLAFPVYGRVPAGQPISVGNYQMNISVILNY